MIAVDTSSLRRFLAGEAGEDVDAVALSVENGQVVLPPIVLAEIVSDPELQPTTIERIARLPLLEILVGYWMRVGLLRAKIIESGRKAKMADALIAQSCLDHKTPLITNDRDFRHYTPHGLVLL